MRGLASPSVGKSSLRAASGDISVDAGAADVDGTALATAPVEVDDDDALGAAAAAFAGDGAEATGAADGGDGEHATIATIATTTAIPMSARMPRDSASRRPPRPLETSA